MQAKLVRISGEDHSLLRRVAKRDGKSLAQVVRDAIRAYERKKFWDECEERWRALRADPKAWAEELAERKQLDGTLMDGLREEGCYDDPRVRKYFSQISAKRSAANKRVSARR